MITYVEHKDIDKNKWNNCIKKSTNPLIYGYSWYLDVVSPFWDALIYNEYEAVFPLSWRKKYGIYYLYQPAFTQQLGIFSVKGISPEIIVEFIKSIPSHFKLSEINFNTENKIPNRPDYTLKQNITYLLSLDEKYEFLHSQYSENLKRNLKKAEKENFVIEEVPEISYLIQIFRENRGKKLKTLGVREYEMLEKLVKLCREYEKITIYHLKTASGKIIAGMIIPESDNNAVFLFSSVSEEAKKAGAMPYLIDHYIKTHAGKKILFDFEGSNDKNIARFYSGFGSKEYVYLHLKKNDLPFYIKWLKTD